MDDFSNFFIGAYATSPTLLNCDKDKEVEYYSKIKDELNIRGLELPFWGTIHKYDEALYLSLLDEQWEYVLTCLPGTIKSLEKNPYFGLASDDENGRMEAIKFYKKASEAVKKINSYFGSRKVISVALASSPSLKTSSIKGSSKSLKKSLELISTFEWDGAKLVIEHCDSGREIDSIKGFLSLEEEIEAIEYVNKKCNKSFGMTVNWARSVLENRSLDTPINHIKKLSECNLLSGLIFSGTSANSVDYGNWTDLHLPIAEENGIEYYEKSSLLTAIELKKSLLCCDIGELDYLGVKVLSIPIRESELDRRIGLNRDTMKILKQIIKEIE